MEEFQNLNWSWKTHRSAPSNLYDTNFSDDEKDIFLCHLNEIDQIHLLDDYGKDRSFTDINFVRKDPRTGQEVTQEVIDHGRHAKGRLFPDFPRRSSMNSQQHQSCLNAITKLNASESTLSMSDRNDIRTYAQLFLERTKEKTEFLEFVKGQFIKNNIRNCQNLQPELNKFIMKRWKESTERVVASNQNYYQLQSAIPLNHSRSSDEIKIEFEKTVEENGIVLAVNRTKYTNPIKVSCSFLEYFYQNDTENVVRQEDFLTSESVDVAISLTTLASMLSYSMDLSIDWSITFSLKMCDNKKVLVFDEILPPTSSSTFECLEKNRKAYKYGVIANIVVPKKKQIFSFKENNFVQRELPFLDNSTTSILLLEPVTSYKAWRFEEYLNKFVDPISKVNETPHGNTDRNHISRLWMIKKNDIDFCRLSINNSQDFCEKQADGSVQFINLSPKVEYQCEFGAEQMTLSELISEWCELRFGPNTVTDRVRIDASKSCILEAKQITIADVENDLQRLYQIKKDVILQQLFQYINIIKEFPPNDYMLRHQRKHNAQAMVYVKSNDTRSTNVIRIADIYDSKKMETFTIPWNPIDDVVCTSIHKQSVVMPCAFPYWGKKTKKSTKNDRTRIVERAVQKKQAKQNAIAEKIALQKRKKKNRRGREKKEEIEVTKRLKLKFEGESLDPNEIFDEQGNIQLISTVVQHSLNKVVNKQPEEEKNISLGTICYESYRRDAEVNSDDSVTIQILDTNQNNMQC